MPPQIIMFGMQNSSSIQNKIFKFYAFTLKTKTLLMLEISCNRDLH